MRADVLPSFRLSFRRRSAAPITHADIRMHINTIHRRCLRLFSLVISLQVGVNSRKLFQGKQASHRYTRRRRSRKARTSRHNEVRIRQASNRGRTWHQRLANRQAHHHWLRSGPPDRSMNDSTENVSQTCAIMPWPTRH